MRISLDIARVANTKDPNPFSKTTIESAGLPRRVHLASTEIDDLQPHRSSVVFLKSSLVGMVVSILSISCVAVLSKLASN